MDLETIQQQIAEFAARTNRQTVEQAVKRELMMGGGLAGAAANVAGLIHQQQQNANQQAHWGTQAAPLSMPHVQMGQGIAGGTYPDDGKHVTDGILASFKSKDQATWEFATATAQLLSARIRASYSPNRSPHCTPRHEYIVWQLFNHNWMVDVQWVGDATGGSEEQWTSHFAKLADRISEARERGDKQYGDEQPNTLTAGAIHRAQQMLNAAAQQSQLGMHNAAQAMSNQALNTLFNQQGNQYASVAGQHASSSNMGARGDSSQADSVGGVLGVGI